MDLEELKLQQLKLKQQALIASQQPTTAPDTSVPDQATQGRTWTDTLKSAVGTPAIATGNLVATALGAPADIAGATADYLGYPNAAQTLHNNGIESFRQAMGIPGLEDTAKYAGRSEAEKLLDEAIGTATGGSIIRGAGAARPMLDAASGALGEGARATAAALGAGPTGQGIATLVGGMSPVIPEVARLGAADRAMANASKTISGLSDPTIDLAEQRAGEFTNAGLQPPPIGSLTGDKFAEALQDDVLRKSPEAATAESQRQAATDAALRAQVVQATPEGTAAPISEALQQKIDVARQAGVTKTTAARDALEHAQKEAADAASARQQGTADVVAQAKQNVADALDALTQNAKAPAEQAVAGLPVGQTKYQAGLVLKDALSRQRDIFDAASDNAYSRTLAGTDNMFLPTDSVIEAAQKAGMRRGLLTAGNEEVPPIVKDIAESDQQVYTPKELQTDRSILLKKMREAMGGNPPNYDAASKIGKVLDAMNDTMDEFAKKIPALRPVNSWYRDVTARLYGGEFRDIGRNLTRLGGIEVDPSAFVQRFLNSDSAASARESMDRFIKAYGDIPGTDAGSFQIPAIPSQGDALAAMRERIIHEMRMVATDPPVTNVVDGTKLAKWVGQHQEALSLLPDLNSELKSVADAQVLANQQVDELAKRADFYRKEIINAARNPTDPQAAAKIAEARAGLKDAESEARTSVSTLEKQYADTIADPEGKVEFILAKSGFKARAEIRKMMADLDGNPDAQNGLKATIWKKLEERTLGRGADGATLDAFASPDAFDKMMQTHGQLIEQLFGTGQKDMLNRIGRLVRMNDAMAVPKPSIPATPTNNLVSHLAGKAWALGLGGWREIPFVLAGESARRVNSWLNGLTATQAQGLLRAAVLDPAAARTLKAFANTPRSMRLFGAVRALADQYNPTAITGVARGLATRAELRERNRALGGR